MNFFDQPYYREHKLRLSWIGQWPFDSTIKKRAIILTMCTIMLPELFGKICCLGDMDMFFDNFPLIMGHLACCLKIYIFYMKSDVVKELLISIKASWDMLKTAEETELMHWYAEKGRIISKYYSRIFSLGLLSVAMMPVAPRMIFRIGNMSAPRPLPHHLNYFVINEDHYYPILVHAYMSVFVTILNLVAFEAVFILFVYHVCGIFSLLQYKLEHIVESKGHEDESVSSDKGRRALSCRSGVHCVTQRYNKMRMKTASMLVKCRRSFLQGHSRCTENAFVSVFLSSYVEVMESLYQIIFFLQTGMNVIIMSLAAFRAVATMSAPQALMRQLALSAVKVIHLYFECHLCQQIIDQSLRLQTSLANSTWYLTSFRTRKLINLMIVRSQVPCTLTAGKLFVVSIEFCGNVSNSSIEEDGHVNILIVVRTSISYFTVLLSLG